MGQILTDNVPVMASNLEAMLAQLGFNSTPGALFHPKFGDFSAMTGAAPCGFQAMTWNPITQNANLSYSINSLRLTPFFVPKTIHIDQIAFVIQAVGTAGARARCGLYASSQVTPFLPTTLLLDGGDQDATVLNAKITNVDLVLQGGQVYWGVYICGTAAPTVLAFTTTHGEPMLGYQISAAANTAIGTQSITIAQNYGALPLTLAANGVAAYTINGNGPGVYYRIN